MARNWEDGSLVGRGGFSLLDLDGEAVLELGWAVRDALTGRGYATRSDGQRSPGQPHTVPAHRSSRSPRCTTTPRRQSCGVWRCSRSARSGAKASSRASSASSRTHGSRSTGFDAPASVVSHGGAGRPGAGRSTGAPRAERLPATVATVAHCFGQDQDRQVVVSRSMTKAVHRCLHKRYHA